MRSFKQNRGVMLMDSLVVELNLTALIVLLMVWIFLTT
jgi:hypothetical protein